MGNDFCLLLLDRGIIIPGFLTWIELDCVRPQYASAKTLAGCYLFMDPSWGL